MQTVEAVVSSELIGHRTTWPSANARVAIGVEDSIVPVIDDAVDSRIDQGPKIWPATDVLGRGTILAILLWRAGRLQVEAHLVRGERGEARGPAGALQAPDNADDNGRGARGSVERIGVPLV